MKYLIFFLICLLTPSTFQAQPKANIAAAYNFHKISGTTLSTCFSSEHSEDVTWSRHGMSIGFQIFENEGKTSRFKSLFDFPDVENDSYTVELIKKELVVSLRKSKKVVTISLEAIDPKLLSDDD